MDAGAPPLPRQIDAYLGALSVAGANGSRLTSEQHVSVSWVKSGYGQATQVHENAELGYSIMQNEEMNLGELRFGEADLSLVFFL